MFGKITCKKCKERVSKSHSFCPHCGNYLSPCKKPKEKKEDWGMLGEEDEMDKEDINPFHNSLLGGFTGKMFNSMLASTMKMLEKEMQKSMKDVEKVQNTPQTHFELYINGKRVNPENIKITQKQIQYAQNKNPSANQRKNKNFNKFFSVEESKRFAQLPLKEPHTNLRRLSDKIIYEISVPGVKSIENVSIVKMGSSIEVKAISKENSYFKIIPLDLNILNYEISDETIVLELKE